MSETPKEAAKRLAGPMLDKGFIPAALHAYTDPDGNPIFWRIRCKHPETGDKWIRPIKMNGEGYELAEPKFTGGKPLYGLHHIASNPAATVWIVEGELKLNHTAMKSGDGASTNDPGRLEMIASLQTEALLFDLN